MLGVAYRMLGERAGQKMLVERDWLELNSIFRRERTELDGEGLC